MDSYRGEAKLARKPHSHVQVCCATGGMAAPRAHHGPASSGVFCAQRKLTKSFASYKQPLAAAGNRSRVSAELEWLFQELDGLSATRSNT